MRSEPAVSETSRVEGLWVSDKEVCIAMSSDYAKIVKCGFRFRFQCPMNWDKLAPTRDPYIRKCEICRSNVHYCATPREALKRARKGQCIAFANWELEGDVDGNPEGPAGNLVVGMPGLEPLREARAREELAQVRELDRAAFQGPADRGGKVVLDNRRPIEPNAIP
jgi:hypothetical protein